MPILRFSLALISQGYKLSTTTYYSLTLVIDKTRILKTLRTSRSHGAPPLLQEFASEMEEAQFIAREIKRLSVYSSGPFSWKDFAVLRENLPLSYFFTCSSILDSEIQCIIAKYRNGLTKGRDTLPYASGCEIFRSPRGSKVFNFGQNTY